MLATLIVAAALTAPDSPSIKVGGMIQPELTFFPGDTDDAYTGGFQFRRMRPMMTATWGFATLRLVPELAGRVRGQDVYLDLTLQKDDCGSLVLRLGKDKPPISIDLLQSSTHLAFLERGPTAQLVADRDIGIALHLKRAAFEAVLMVGNGTADLSNVDEPTGDYEVYGRVGMTLGPLYLGASGSVGEAADDALPSYRSGGRREIYGDDEVVDSDPATRWRAGGHVRVELGPALVWAELIQSSHRVTVGAWQAGASLLIGPSTDNAWNRYDRPGDVEIAARVGQLAVDLFDPPNSADQLGYTSAAFAISWTIDPHLKLIGGYEATFWDGALDDRADEHVVGLRLQALLLEIP